ncbi:MAG TPA: hypothetical protein VG166_01165 [Caulobacteraceae bacterium]|jgi:hypothetical protein|nr:hypothetical protein [Caulobacteraceae bacterium]
MAAKTLNGAYPGGYYLQAAYRILTIGAAGSVGGAGVTTTNTHASSIYNQGTVAGATYGIQLADGGLISNGGATDSTALIEGGRTKGGAGAAILVATAEGTVVNAATITSAATPDGTYASYYGPSVLLEEGGMVTNSSTLARIANGVTISGRVGTVTNEGTVLGTYYDYYKASPPPYPRNFYIKDRTVSVEMTSGGSVENGANGSIPASLANGVYISGGRGSVTNNGFIGGPTSCYYTTYPYSIFKSGVSVRLTKGGMVLNGTGANQSADIAYGVQISGRPGTVVNSGTIEGTLFTDFNQVRGSGFSERTTAVLLQNGGAVTNGSTTNGAATIGSVGITGYGSVANFGTIGSGVEINGPGSVANFDTIGGVEISGIGAVANFGTINYVHIFSRGTVTNGGAANSSAAIINYGIAVETGALGVVVNYGLISSTRTLHPHTDFAVYLGEDGTLVNGAADNTTAEISGSNGIKSYNGGKFHATGTVINFGTIAAMTAGRYAVQLRSPSSRMIEEGSGHIIGELAGGGGTLELAAAAGAGTITGIGSQKISGFALIQVDAGAGWHFTGANYIAPGALLTNAAAIVDQGVLTNKGTISLAALLQLTTSATLTNAAGGQVLITGDRNIAAASGATGTQIDNSGLLKKSGGTGSSVITSSIVNSGTIVASIGLLELNGPVTGTGVDRVGTGATLEFRDAVAATQTVTFTGPNAVLELADAAAFAASVRKFAAGETLDIRSVPFGSATTASYSGTATAGTLTVANGVHTAQIRLIGQFIAADFAAASDGQGGTDITYSGASAAPALATVNGHA